MPVKNSGDEIDQKIRDLLAEGVSGKELLVRMEPLSSRRVKWRMSRIFQLNGLHGSCDRGRAIRLAVLGKLKIGDE